MPTDESVPSISFGLHLGTEIEASQLDRESPFRIAVLGDFCGRAGHRQSGERWTPSRPRIIDRDNFEQVMQQLNVRLERLLIAPDRQPISIQIGELDDFDPDVLFQKLDVFASLRNLRERLLRPESFDGAAQEVLAWGSLDEGPSTAEEDSDHVGDEPLESPDVDHLLDQILDDGQTGRQLGLGGIEAQVQRLVAEIAAPYALPAADPRQQDLVACVDTAIELMMRMILQHPRFKKLEADWRALHQLVFDLETGTSLKVFLIDVTQSELAEDLFETEDLARTRAYKLLVEQTVGTPGGQPWSLLVGSYRFNESEEDVSMLGRLAKIAAAAGAPFVAGAESGIVGSPPTVNKLDLDDWREVSSGRWQTLRQLPEASFLGLLWPRYLVRLPYGASTKPLEQFAFEEVGGIQDKQRLLWGNPAFLLANMMGQAFMRSGWQLNVRQVMQVNNLPVWVYQEDGEPQMHPCGEMLLTEKIISRISALGVMPLISVQDQPALRIDGVNSVAGSPLRGRWN